MEHFLVIKILYKSPSIYPWVRSLIDMQVHVIMLLDVEVPGI